MATINIYGEPGGRYNIVVNNQLLPISLDAFGSLLSSVQTVTDTGFNLVEYRPNMTNKPFTYMEPGSGYIINALSSFNLEDPSLTGSWNDTLLWNDKFYWKEN
jgi:hypothetical protein